MELCRASNYLYDKLCIFVNLNLTETDIVATLSDGLI